MTRALIIATNRPKSFTEWKDKWELQLLENNAHLYVMVDSQDQAVISSIRHSVKNASVYSHGDVLNVFKKRSWIIPKRTSACKSFAIYMAWRDGAGTIYCLDDDCYPATGNFFDEHDNQLKRRFNNAVHETATVRARGTPYISPLPVALNHGGWLGIPDIDAVTQLQGHQNHGMVGGYIPIGALFPFSGMNWACIRNIMPLMYFGLQGESWPVDRFDDIWCGFITKKILDHLGYTVHSGEPCIEHVRASDPFVNIEKEAHGYGMNVGFYRFIMGYDPEGETPLDCIRHAGKAIEKWGEDQIRQDGKYWKKYGEAIQAWASLFKED